MFFAVRLQRGGPWDWSRELREQDGWEEHARFMDSLVEEGFIVLGEPLDGGREILHAICASSEEALRRRLAEDNWTQSGMLTVTSVEASTVLLDGRSGQGRAESRGAATLLPDGAASLLGPRKCSPDARCLRTSSRVLLVGRHSPAGSVAGS